MDIRSQIRGGLLKRGLAPHIADAFIMNFEDESGLNPGINEIKPLVPGSRGGYGLYQLTGPRRRQYEAYAQERGAPLDSVDAQLDFMMQELGTTEKRAAQKIFAAKDKGSAAAAIVNSFLRPAESHRARRVARYTGGQVSGGGSDNTVLGGLSIQPSRAPDMLQDQEAPMQQEPARATGILGSLFPEMTADRQDRIALALGGLSMHPNQAVMQMARQRIGDRREDAKEAKQTQAAAAQATKTMQWLQSQAGTNPQAAQALQMLGAGVIDPRSAVAMATQRGEDERTALMKNVEYIRSQNPDMSMQDAIQIARSGTTVNVNNGGSEIGTIPQGFELVTDPDTGARSMRPIPGGPEDSAKKDAASAANAAASTDIITRATDRAEEAYNARVLDGLPGQIAGQINPANQNAELYRQVEVLKSNAKIENLNAMRAASPTGGALGSVTEKESAMLASAAGALDPASPNFLRDLRDYEEMLLRVIHKGLDAPATTEATTPQGAPQPVPNFQEMSDEELDAYIQKMEGR